MQKPLTVTVVICTKDREQILRQTLVTVLLQTRRPDEVVIVDDGCMDGDDLCAWLEAHGIACRYLRKQPPSLTASRNLAVRETSTDVLLFLDDDVVLDTNYIREIMRLFEEDVARTLGGATGTLQITYKPGVRAFLQFFLLDGQRPGAILTSGATVLVREGEISEPTEVDWLSGCNMAYRREVFDALRFDQGLASYGWGEDRDFSYRVNKKWRLMASPYARLVHLKVPSGRINEVKFGYMQTNHLYRFYAKSMPKTSRHRLAFSWSMFGIVLRNVLMTVASDDRRAAAARLRGNLRGLVGILTGKDYTD